MRPTPGILSFPLGGTAGAPRLDWARDNQSVREVLWNILLTRPGERLLRPQFGAGLGDFIHHPNNETTRQLIADAARRAIVRWEPRVELLEVHASTDPLHLSQVTLSIRYRLKYNGAQDSLDLVLELAS